MYASQLKRQTRRIDGLKPETFNAFLNSLKDKSLTQPGYLFADGQQAIRPARTLRNYTLFTCESELIERSVFGIILNPLQEYNDPPIVLAENINALSNASPFQLFTNVEAYNPTDGFGRCKAIEFYEPTLLFVSDEANIPLVGMPCGPDYDTDNWGISGQSYGLICISQLDIDTNNVWCIRTPDPIAVIGTIVDENIPPYNSGILGEGLLQVQYRNPDADNELVNANGPDGEPLQLLVFNSGSSAFNVGDLVKCIAVTGVGLVIVDTKSLVVGRAVENILHYTAGLVEIYTGLPGQETASGIESVAFNQLGEIVANEFCFLMPTGAAIPETVEETVPAGETVEIVGEDTPELEQTEETELPEDVVVQYYIVNSEYGGKILGKTVADSDSNEDNTVGVEIYAGEAGAEVATGETITAYIGEQGLFGAIPLGSWVVAVNIGYGPDVPGAWYITASQRGNNFIGFVKVGQAGNNGYIDVDEPVTIWLYTGNVVDKIDLPTGIDVEAICRFGPLCEEEVVWVEWNGECFAVIRGELDGGFFATAQQSEISQGSTGYVVTNSIANSLVHVASLKVDSPLGTVEQGRTVFVTRNRGGFHISVKSCN